MNVKKYIKKIPAWVAVVAVVSVIIVSAVLVGKAPSNKAMRVAQYEYASCISETNWGEKFCGKIKKCVEHSVKEYDTDESAAYRSWLCGFDVAKEQLSK